MVSNLTFLIVVTEQTGYWLTSKGKHSFILCHFVYMWRTLPPFSFQAVFWGPYFPLRTTCLISGGNYQYFWVCIITSLILEEALMLLITPMLFFLWRTKVSVLKSYHFRVFFFAIDFNWFIKLSFYLTYKYLSTCIWSIFMMTVTTTVQKATLIVNKYF